MGTSRINKSRRMKSCPLHCGPRNGSSLDDKNYQLESFIKTHV